MLNQDLRISPIDMHKTKISRMVILSLPSVNFKHHGMSFACWRVGPFTKSSILNSENKSDRPFPYSIPSHFLGISQIYKSIAALPHHALFPFTCFAVKNYETYNLIIRHSPLLSIPCNPILKPIRPLFILGNSLLSLPHLCHLRTCL